MLRTLSDRFSKRKLEGSIQWTLPCRTLKLHVDDESCSCSDGLTEMLSHAEIGEVLRGEPNPEAACTRLISLANERGGQDNITAIVARFSASPATTGNAFGNEP